MEENLARLWVLQVVDNEIDALTRQAEKIPREIEALRLQVTDLHQDMETTKQHLIDLKKQYKLAEVDLKTSEDKISHYSVQLYSAKTNEQYKAFLNEIEAQKRSKAELEERMITILEETETTEGSIKVHQSDLEQAERNAQTEIEKLEATKHNLDQEIKSRGEEHQKIIAQLHKEFLRTYERIKTGKGGIAVVRITDERCGGCLTPLPPQLVEEVHTQDHLIFCEYCGRILIAPVE